MTHTAARTHLDTSRSHLRQAFHAVNEARFIDEDKMTADHLRQYIMQLWHMVDRIDPSHWTEYSKQNTKKLMEQTEYQSMSDMVHHMTSPDIFSGLPKNIAKGYWALKISIGQLEQALADPIPYPAQLYLDYGATMK